MIAMMNQAIKKELTEEIFGRTNSYRTKTANEIANLEPCPQSADDVYSLGMILQDYVSNILADIQAACSKDQIPMFQDLALKQVSIKEAILNFANDNLNWLLHTFYSNGGPVMDPPAIEKMARDIQPFFKRISSNYLDELDVIAKLAYNGTINASEFEHSINNYTSAMYETMSKLFPAREMQNAFDKLIQVR